MYDFFKDFVWGDGEPDYATLTDEEVREAVERTVKSDTEK